MAATSDEEGIFSSALLNFDSLEPHVLVHLRNVYSCLSLGMLTAALGAYTHFHTAIGEWSGLTTTLSVVLILWLAFTNYSKEDAVKRVGIFNVFTFLSGASVGSLLELVIRIDPSIVTTALAGSAVLFISLSLAALLSNDRKFIYMGGVLFAALFLQILIGFMNSYLGSRIVFDIYIWCSFILFSVFVLYDTQLIVEKRFRGDEDYVWHALALFLDAAQIFRSILIILAKKEYNKTRRRNN